VVSEQPALPGLRAQHPILSQKVREHYAYYGITGNFRMLKAFLRAVQRAWRWWLEVPLPQLYHEPLISPWDQPNSGKPPTTVRTPIDVTQPATCSETRLD